MNDSYPPNKNAAEMIVKLLPESCRHEAETAVKYEGNVTIQTRFRVFGRAAAQELFAHPEVTAAISGLDKHFDREKLQS